MDVQIHPQGRSQAYVNKGWWPRLVNSRSLGDAEESFWVDAPLVLAAATPVGATYDHLGRIVAFRKSLVPLKEDLAVEHDQGVLHLRASKRTLESVMVDSLVMGYQAKNVICLDAQWGALMRPGGPKIADVPKVHLDRTDEYGARPGNQLSPDNVNFAAVVDRIEGHHSLLYHRTMNMTE